MDIIILAAFDFDIQFVSSKQNAVADALSRLTLSTVEATDKIFQIEEKCLDSLPPAGH